MTTNIDDIPLCETCGQELRGDVCETCSIVKDIKAASPKYGWIFRLLTRIAIVCLFAPVAAFAFGILLGDKYFHGYEDYISAMVYAIALALAGLITLPFTTGRR